MSATATVQARTFVFIHLQCNITYSTSSTSGESSFSPYMASHVYILRQSSENANTMKLVTPFLDNTVLSKKDRIPRHEVAFLSTFIRTEPPCSRCASLSPLLSLCFLHPPLRLGAASTCPTRRRRSGRSIRRGATLCSHGGTPTAGA
jgi:hypothetical protein